MGRGPYIYYKKETTLTLILALVFPVTAAATQGDGDIRISSYAILYECVLGCYKLCSVFIFLDANAVYRLIFEHLVNCSFRPDFPEYLARY